VHIAISGLTWPYGATERIGAFEIVHADHHEHAAGRAKASVGRLTIRSVVTHVEAHTEFAALHLGDHNFTCGVRPWGDEAAYELLRDEVGRWFDTADFLEVTRTIDEHVPGRTHSLRSLFRDEQRRVLGAVLADSLAETEEAYRAIHRDQAPLMRYLAELGVRIPRALGRAAEVVLNADLDRELSRQAADAGTVQQLLDEAARFEVELDRDGLSHTLSATIERMTRTTAGFLASDDEDFDEFSPDHEGTLRRIRELIAIVEQVPFEVDLAPAQDLLWRTLQRHQVALRARADAGDATAGRWCSELATMADALGIAATELTRPGHTDTVGGAPPGRRYRYRLHRQGHEPVDRPDPASRWQPEGVHGPSAVDDPDAFAWTDDGFTTPALFRQVIYELHVGTFSPDGTFDGVIDRLPHLVELGVTSIELLPVWQFPGAELGLRRRAAIRRPGQLRRTAGTAPARRRGPRGTVSGSSSTWCTTTWARGQLPRRLRPVHRRTATPPLGTGDERRRARRRSRPPMDRRERRRLRP
jgi:hypothetical protein